MVFTIEPSSVCIESQLDQNRAVRFHFVEYRQCPGPGGTALAAPYRAFEQATSRWVTPHPEDPGLIEEAGSPWWR
jgi:hypothetical protein